MLRSVIESVYLSDFLSGWFKLPVANLDNYLKNLEISLFYNDRRVSTGDITVQRRDVTAGEYVGYGFKISLPQNVSSLDILKNCRVEIRSLDLSLQPTYTGCIESIREVFSNKNFITNRLNLAIKLHHQILGSDALVQYPFDYKLVNQKREMLAVVTYANSDDAWFIYFLKHYRDLYNKIAIYVVTPNPQQFQRYDLSGVVGIKGFAFDDTKRAKLISDFQNGLKGYFKWVISCDVDEMIVITPPSGLSIEHFLNELDLGTYISWGVDVIQEKDEVAFDFERGITEQRNFGVINTALCKPAISSVDVSYSKGFHFSSKKPMIFETPIFVTYHMKWACRDIKIKLSDMFSKTECLSEHTKNYFLESSNPNNLHPILSTSFQMIDFRDSRVIGFIMSYYSNLKYGMNDFWCSYFKCSPWVVSIKNIEV
ncbi:MAG: hypothetical protein ACRC2N_05640 [Aeromonas sp.]